ncbi:MAG: zinc-binding dehydrogenase [Candidatus Poribacteria bacterium]|nr:zinc-binding dehydrogenase [Candidatus Poribacteria bacterium]
MKVAAVLGEHQAGLVEVPDPIPKEDWVVVKIHASPMCTEYHAFEHGYKTDRLGHEAAGEVVDMAQPGKVEIGDRVVVMPQYPCGKCALCTDGDYIHCENNYNFEEFVGTRHGSATMAQYILKPSWLLPKIPDDVSYEHASLACCALGPSYRAFDEMGVNATHTVLITGIGPVGFGAIANARFRGAKVIAAELIPWRAERARQMGVEAVINPTDDDAVDQIRDLTTDGRGVDFALDCSGNVHAHRLCIDTTRRRGTIAFVGQSGTNDTILHVSPDLIGKGLRLMGAWHYNLNQFPGLMKVIEGSPLLDLLISNIFPMSEIQKAFETSASQESSKIILKPWE